jgi:pyridoxine 5-phosphate synthase
MNIFSPAMDSPAHTALSVNVNKIALLRNSRHLDVPNLLGLAQIALDAGAHGITIHPRPDERHIRATDVAPLSELTRRYPHAEFNIEGNPFHQLMDFIRAERPHQCTFVPDAESQFTSDHGWDLRKDADRLAPLVAEAKSLGVRVSLFMDPLPEAMAAVKALGADRVELYTESYAHAAAHGKGDEVITQFAAAARAAQACGLGVNAGHDLNLSNLRPFLRGVPQVLEVSIGHALIADALSLGLHGAVQAYLRAMHSKA